MTDIATRFPVERRKDPSCAEDMAMIRKQMAFLIGELMRVKEWQSAHEASSVALLDMQGDLKSLITGLRWLLLTVKIISWGGSAALGILVLIQTVLPLVGFPGNKP